MRFLRLYLIGIIILLVVLYFTCCTPLYNIPKIPLDTTPTPDLTIEQDKNTLIFVAFSGGGSRAAAMSWAFLEYLDKISYSYINEDSQEVQSTLARQIDYISGISGGSFAAAGWCLYKDSMEVFKQRFIEKNIQAQLLKGLFWPPSQGLKVLFSWKYDRINVAAEYYDKYVFGRKAFGDLPPYPVLWVNATHLALGDRFTYTPEYFGMLNSEIARYPLGYACAASSAFPILLSPITLYNYGETYPDSVLMMDPKYRMAKKNARQDIEKDYYCRMREFYNDKANRYMHLADGGLVDNQGLQVIIDAFGTNGIINKALNDYYNPIKRLVIINVNAGVLHDDKSCEEENAPKITSVINYTMTLSMDILSAKRWEQIKNLRDQVWQAKTDTKGEEAWAEEKPKTEFLKPYCIEISFRNIKNDSLRHACLNLPTSFHLKKEQLNMIYSTVPRLIEEDPDMTQLLVDINLPLK